MFTVSMLKLWRENQNFKELAEISRASAAEAAYDEKDIAGNQDNQERFAELYGRNKDFIGWIAIEDTGIDYPVMQKADEPEYYLYRDFEEKPSSSGVPFLGEGCGTDSSNIIIYGHNMKNGTMFSPLLRYSEESYWKEHPILSFDTMETSSEYEMIAAFQEEVHYQDETNAFRYYHYGGTLTEQQFLAYVSNIKRLSLYDTGNEAVYGEQLLTLSTCSYHKENGRFVVVAKKVTSE